MRDIKFRAWEPVNKILQYMDFCLYAGSTVKMFALPLGRQNLSDSYSVMNLDALVIEQYTGLHDKNGREVYEGDIVSRNVPRARNGVIQFARGIFGINWDYAQNPDPEWLEGTMYGSWCGKHNLRPIDDGYVSENMEVIGNIHENHELIEASHA